MHRGVTEQLRCERPVEISPPAFCRQVRLAARMLTVGVDTAAAVVNLHMVTRAGLQLRNSCQSRATVPETVSAEEVIGFEMCQHGSRDAFNDGPRQQIMMLLTDRLYKTDGQWDGSKKCKAKTF